jgi:hypothetical protein
MPDRNLHIEQFHLEEQDGEHWSRDPGWNPSAIPKSVIEAHISEERYPLLYLQLEDTIWSETRQLFCCRNHRTLQDSTGNKCIQKHWSTQGPNIFGALSELTFDMNCSPLSYLLYQNAALLASLYQQESARDPVSTDITHWKVWTP